MQVLNRESKQKYQRLWEKLLIEVSRDITERKRAEEALRESEECYRMLIQQSVEAIYMFDPETKRVSETNPAFLNLLGYKAEEVHTLTVYDFVAHDRESIDANIQHILTSGGTTVGERVWRRKNRALIDVRVTASKTQQGGRDIIFVVARDITERKRAEEATKLAYAELNQIFNTVAGGMRVIDKDFNVLRVNQTFLTLSGISKDEAVDKKCYEAFHGPLCHTPNCPLTRILGGKEYVECEVEKERNDGLRIPCIVIATPFRGPGGELIGIVEDFRDITEHKQAEKALQRSEQKYRSLVNNVKLGIFRSTPGPTGRFLEVNPAMEEITGYPRKELLSMNVSDLYVHPEEREAVLEEMATAVGKATKELNFRKKDGAEIVVSDTKAAVKDNTGKVLYFDGIIEDITERKRMEETLKASEQEYRDLYKKTKILAERDPLTDLFNHRRISKFLENEIERAKRKEEVFSIMMLDVDDLKLINDAYGHLVGDKLLKNIADILRNSCRSIDLIGRYGGDEFLVILPYTHGEEAKNIGQRIYVKTQKQGLKIARTTTNIPFRLSIGVATYPFDSMVSKELIALADRRMYASKQSGKSVVSVSVPEVKEYLITKEPTLSVLEGLVNAVNGKDHYTKAHSELVTRFSLSLGKEVNLSHEEMEALRIAGLLHDIGKIGIPENILRKPGPLEREEFELIKQHPRLGAMMIDGPPPHREYVLDAIKYHHERYDGKGYPGRLKGEDIPLLARIIGIVDAYCAMITDRPYRKAWTQDEAIAELEKGAGTQFDPELVAKFIRCLKERKF